MLKHLLDLRDVMFMLPRIQLHTWRLGMQHLAAQLATITGFDSMSMQPNSGASGEYAGLMAIRAYHKSRGDTQRKVCIIPVSAHGTNPASAVMAGMSIVPIGVDRQGNIDIEELRRKAEENKDKYAHLLLTMRASLCL